MTDDRLGLTVRQAEALDAIRRLSAAGHSPSMEEIGAALGVHRSSAHRLVRALEARGALRLGDRQARSIALADT